MNACEQDAIDVKQRFDAARALLVKESPLRLGETEIVMAVMTSNTGLRNRLQLIVLRRRMQNERREELLEHIAVFLEQQSEELLHIVRDQVNLQTVAHGRNFNRFTPRIEAYDFARRQYVNASQIVIGIWRREAEKMRAADRREQKRIRLSVDFAVNSRIKLHIEPLSTIDETLLDRRVF